MSSSRANDFFALFRNKLLAEPSPQFDQEFWAKFDHEFRDKKRGKIHTFFEYCFNPKIYFPAFATAAIILGIFIFQRREPNSSEMMAHAELLSNIDLFETVDDVAMSEEDWNLLLTGQVDDEKS